MTFSDKTIFLIDDDKDFCFLLEMMFKKIGSTIIIATNGEEALDLIHKERILERADIVLLDLQIPRISGFTLIDEIREMKPEIPVLAVTAFATEREHENCVKSGFDDFLSKPFSEKELMQRITKLIK